MSNPHLEAVQGNAEIRESGAAQGAHAAAGESPSESTNTDSAATRTDTHTDERGHRGVPIWLFLLAIIALALVIGWQFQMKGQLEGEIAGLTQELHAAESLLGAHESRLGEIRSGVRDLTNQLAGLASLIEADVSAGSERDSEADSARPERTRSTAPVRQIPARLSR